MSLDLTAAAEKMNPTTPPAAILIWLDDAARAGRISAVARRADDRVVGTAQELVAVRCEAAVVVLDDSTAKSFAELAASDSLPFAAASVCLSDCDAVAATADVLQESFGAESPIDVYVPLEASDGELSRAIRSAREIAGLRARLRHVHLVGGELARLASTDPLTELPNRRGWNELFARLVERTERDGVPFCTAIVDLDEFKQANDEQGHAVGDEVLRAVAEAFRATMRAGDFCARLGGDEFGLLLPGLPEGSAEQVFQRIRNAATRLLSERGLPAVTCSFGYAIASESGDYAADALFEAADTALRSAKRAGRDRILRGTILR